MEDDVSDAELLKRWSGPHSHVIYSASCASSHPEKKTQYLVSYLFIFLSSSVTLTA